VLCIKAELENIGDAPAALPCQQQILLLLHASQHCYAAPVSPWPTAKLDLEPGARFCIDVSGL
jgi:hypothetical protein